MFRSHLKWPVCRITLHQAKRIFALKSLQIEDKLQSCQSLKNKKQKISIIGTFIVNLK